MNWRKILEQLRAQRAQVTENMTKIGATLETENRAPTPEEFAELDELRGQIPDIDKRIDDALTALADEERGADVLKRVAGVLDAGEAERGQDGNGDAGKGGAKVRKEPLTYERHNMHNSYLRDMVLANPAFADDASARARLARHQKEMDVELPKFERAQGIDGRANSVIEERTANGVERFVPQFEKRDLSRTDGAGGEFVPPLWMMEEFIEVSRAGRISADLCNRMPLPVGTDSINLPKVATGTTVAAQTADNAAISETDATTTSVQGNVKTIAGQQDIALQLIEQSPVAFDQIVFADLAGDHAAKLDVQVLDGSNASGQVRGILTTASIDTTAYTDASPTLPELYPKIADSLNQVATSRYLPATAIIMHTRRWYWMASALDSSNRPFIVPTDQAPQNALASHNGSTAQGPAGRILGVPVYIDPNVPTAEGGGTEDVIIVGRPNEYYLFEGAVRTRALPEVLSGTLTVRLQLYSYVAFIPDRRGTQNTSIVSGTGLAAPSF